MAPHVKQFERSAVVSFCPQGGLLAAGTAAGAIDMSFSTNSVLEVYALDFTSTAEAPLLVGSVQASERFNRLAWSAKVADSTSQPLGIIAGGLADGTVLLWDPSVMVDKQGKAEGRVSLLAKMQKHTGAVKGLEFNSFSPNLLASGAGDSDLCIWDLAKPTTPSLYPALKGNANAAGVAGNEITYISWNRKVQHILASSTANGTTVVWDLKRQKPVISFRDPNSQRRASVLQWNPDVATQLIVASDDDRSPTLQMWDLRNSVSPLREFVGHTKGVLGMSWSPHDSSLLLSSGKDSRTICWDVHTTDILCELPVGPDWHVDVQWSPTTPGVFTSSSFDGKVGIHNIHHCTLPKVTESVNADFSVTQQSIGASIPLKKAPVWMHRPVGATFGFGGKLVSFSHQKLQQTDPSGQVVVRDHAMVSISQVVTEPVLIESSEKFEHAIAGGDKSTLQGYCLNKSQSVENEDSETWSFLGLLFEQDGRRALLKRLGFGDIIQETPVTAPSMDSVAAGMDGLHVTTDGKAHPSAGGAAPEDFFEQQDDPDFFDKLPEQGIHAGQSPTQAGSHKASFGGAASHASDISHTHDLHSADAAHHPDASQELEDEIQRAMIAGNYEAAVESCFKAHRLADALLIANIFNSSDLFKRTMHRYMKRCPKPYMQILRANVDQDFEALVRTRPVSQWRETLALLATYTAQEEWTNLCDVLAARLNQAGMHHAASLCYICAGNVDQAVVYWSRAAASQGPHVQVLQDIIEKAVIFGLATGNKKASNSLSELVTSYASILAAQGRMSTALDYLEYVPGEASTAVAVLKDRIYRSGAANLPSNTHAPPFPFISEDVQPSTNAMAAAAATTHAYGASAYGAYNATTAYGNQAAAANPYANAYNTAAQNAYQTAAPAANPYAPVAAQPAYTPQSYSGASTPTAAAAQASPYGNMAAAAGQGYAPTATAAPAASAYQQSAGYGAYGSTQAYSPSVSQPQAYTQAPMQTYQPEAAAGQVYQAKRAGGGSGAGATATAPPVAPVPTTFTASMPVPAAGSVTAAQSTPAYAPVTQPTTVQPASYFMPTTSAAAPVVQAPQTFSAAATAAAAAGAPPPAVPGGFPGAGPVHAAPTSQRAAPAAPAPPLGPPANISVATADTSKVPADRKPIINSLSALYSSCAPLSNNPAKKREMDDNNKKIGQLFWKLNAGEVSEGVVPKLLQLCQSIDAADWHTANHIQVQMTTTDWDECGFWLSAVKRLIKMRQQAGM